ncbi:hypothetical protein H0H93_003198, partial [Arthromyces matolae]
ADIRPASKIPPCDPIRSHLHWLLATSRPKLANIYLMAMARRVVTDSRYWQLHPSMMMKNFGVNISMTSLTRRASFRMNAGIIGITIFVLIN